MDVAKKYPEKLNELKALFDELAEKNRLYPLVTWDDVFEKSKETLRSITGRYACVFIKMIRDI